MKRSDVAFVIPVYNEGEVIKGVIDSVLKKYTHVICVDDGSRDNTAAEIQATKALYVRHPINMGQGAALQTGIELVRQLAEVKYFVTFDADGQHRMQDVEHMLETIEKNNVDIVLGSRFLGSTVNMPRAKKVILKAAVRFSSVTSGVKLTDTHNGLRVFNRAVAESMQITMPDMAHASEILEIIARNKFRYAEVPVVIEYTDYSMKKGQSIINAVNIAFDTLLRKIG